MASNALLSIENLSVFHGQFQAVYNLNLAVAAGEIVSIIGANGAGKSSLLKAVVGRVDRIEGAIRFDGVDLAGQSTAAIVGGGVALVPEGRRLFPSLTVEENLNIGWEVGLRGDIGFEEVYGYFPVLRERRRQKARELSGGQQQMVALGRALLASPRLLLCDEISLGLAPIIIRDIYAALADIKQHGTSVVLVEQDLVHAMSVADCAYCFQEGRVSLTGRPRDLSRDAIHAAYFGM